MVMSILIEAMDDSSYFVSLNMGQGDESRIFGTYSEARAWLLEQLDGWRAKTNDYH